MPRTHAIEAIVSAALPRSGKGLMSGNKALFTPPSCLTFLYISARLPSHREAARVSPQGEARAALSFVLAEDIKHQFNLIVL